jgi:5S rRNA maturation endonuclease (ribonuclease M5)
MAAHLAHRGWPTEVVERFGLTVVLDDHRRARIRYPYRAWDGTTWAVCSWQDRATAADVEPKWKAPTGAVLPPYNVQVLDTLDDLAAVVVCEGAPDTITATLALAGRTDIVAVGIAGVNAWRTEWAPMLAAPVVIVAADPDKAGETLTDAIMRDLGRPVIVLDLVGGDLTEAAKAHGLAAVTALLTATVDEATSVVDKPSVVHEPATQGATPVTTGTVEPVSGTATDVMPAPPQWWDRWTALEALGPHRWKVCSTCGEGALASLGRRCLMTPECEGRYVPRAPQGVSA